MDKHPQAKDQPIAVNMRTPIRGPEFYGIATALRRVRNGLGLYGHQLRRLEKAEADLSTLIRLDTPATHPTLRLLSQVQRVLARFESATPTLEVLS